MVKETRKCPVCGKENKYTSYSECSIADETSL